MSERDGKMYVAERIATMIEVSGGFAVDCKTDEIAGVMLVFWTKKAAREHYGRDVRLREIRRVPDDE